ncbi:MAG: ABC transporter permease [Planctomycetota bacterium]
MGRLYLAWKYICFYKFKTVVLLACLFLTLFLPIAIEILLSRFEESVVARAESTPIVIGPKGSRFDLTLRTLYFRMQNGESNALPTLRFGEVQEVDQAGLAKAIPIYSKYTASSYPIVGTNRDYFQLRQLEIANGDPLVQIGDCVIGNELAKKLGIECGDKLLSDMKSVISLASHPLKMHVRGILTANQSPDDWAVFVDLKTAWIIDGIGHGHQDVEEVDEAQLLSKSDDKIIASAAVLPFTEITAGNIASYHFHGDITDFPITSMIAVPMDEKSETILIGRYQNSKLQEQLIIPRDVIGELMGLVFQVKRFFDANAILIAVSTILLLVLIIALSIKIRDAELATMFKIGAAKNTISKLLVYEFVIVFATSLMLVLVASRMLLHFSDAIVRSLLVGV